MIQLRAYKGHYDLVEDYGYSTTQRNITEEEFISLLPVRDEDIFIDGMSVWFI